LGKERKSMEIFNVVVYENEDGGEEAKHKSPHGCIISQITSPPPPHEKY
jgi:hypothetical protein